jgi:hypothetical protein
MSVGCKLGAQRKLYHMKTRIFRQNALWYKNLLKLKIRV